MSSWRSYLDIARNGRFTGLWTGALLSGIGDAVFSVSLLWTIYQRTEDPFLLSLTAVLLEMPGLLTAPIWGVYLDRYPAQRFAILANLVSGSMFLYLLTVPMDTTRSYIILLSLITLSSSLAPVAKSAMHTLIPKLVQEKHLVTANSLMTIQFDLALSLGPILGGILAATENIRIAFLVNAYSFFLAALMIFVATRRLTLGSEVGDQRGERPAATSQTTWYIDLKEAISYVLRVPTVRALVILNFVWNGLIWGASAPLMPIYSEGLSGAGATGYGTLVTLLSVGIMLGSLLSGAYKVRFSYVTVVFAAIGAHGAAYALLAFSPHLLTSSLVILLCGIVSAPAMIYYRTAIQTTIPERMMGRVFTLNGALGTASFPIGTTMAATAVTLVGHGNIAWLFLLFGGLCAVLSGLLYLKLPRATTLGAPEPS